MTKNKVKQVIDKTNEMLYAERYTEYMLDRTGQHNQAKILARKILTYEQKLAKLLKRYDKRWDNEQ